MNKNTYPPLYTTSPALIDYSDYLKAMTQNIKKHITNTFIFADTFALLKKDFLKTLDKSREDVSINALFPKDVEVATFANNDLSDLLPNITHVFQEETNYYFIKDFPLNANDTVILYVEANSFQNWEQSYTFGKLS